MQAQVEVHLTSSAPNANDCEIVSAPATNISFCDANWENYEDLLDPLGEANGPPISDNEGGLQALTQFSTGEKQMVFEGFYLDDWVHLGGGFDASSRRAALIFIRTVAIYRNVHQEFDLPDIS